MHQTDEPFCGCFILAHPTIECSRAASTSFDDLSLSKARTTSRLRRWPPLAYACCICITLADVSHARGRPSAPICPPTSRHPHSTPSLRSSARPSATLSSVMSPCTPTWIGYFTAAKRPGATNADVDVAHEAIAPMEVSRAHRMYNIDAYPGRLASARRAQDGRWWCTPPSLPPLTHRRRRRRPPARVHPPS
jgi:hypothetical protein